MNRKTDARTLKVVDTSKAESVEKQPDKQMDGNYVFDNLEKAIISQLREDGRKPFQTIARELKVDEKTVRNRINRLRDSGVLRIVPTAEGNKLRECIVSLIAVNISPEYRGRSQEVVDGLSKLPGVSWVANTMGRYDIIAEVIVDTREALSRFQLVDLSSVPGVAATEGFLVLSHQGSRGVPFVSTILQPTP